MNLYKRGRKFEKKKKTNKQTGGWVETRKASVLGSQTIKLS